MSETVIKNQTDHQHIEINSHKNQFHLHDSFTEWHRYRINYYFIFLFLESTICQMKLCLRGLNETKKNE